MTKLIFFIAVLASAYSCTAYRPASQRSATVTTQYFYDELSPYGDWVHNREYGYVWIPHAGRNFYPYASNGRWLYTDYGWTWLSDYEWGWAPFHYGRWDFDPQYGWFWFPGNEWAPAWVVWRQGNGYFGWAPMRPETGFGRGYDDIGRWIFVRERDFGKSNIQRYSVNRMRNDEIINSTRIISDNRADNSGRRVYVSGPDPAEVENLTGRRVKRVKVQDSSSPGRRLTNNQLEIYRPRVIIGQDGQRPAPPRISDVKDVRPMRERDRNYQPETPVRNEPTREYGSQGSREVNREQVQNRREKDVQRQYEQEQSEMQRRQQEKEYQQRQKAIEEEDRRKNVNKDYQQNRSERIQRTEQQKKTMQKEREKVVREPVDTSVTKKSERVQSRPVRQNRR